MVHKEDHPGQSSVPMIDMEPGNLSCVYSTLHFICQHASCYEVTPVVECSTGNSESTRKHSVVLRLGEFHTQMSLIGSIGAGSGLQELLETIYADNKVVHMLNGKPVQ